MSKVRPWHVNPETGNPGQCRATKQECPFGASTPHFHDKITAIKYGERAQKLRNIKEQELAAKRKLTPLAYESPDNLKVDYTPSETLKKFLKDIKGNYYPYDNSKNDGEAGVILERLYGIRVPDSKPTADLGETELKVIEGNKTHREVNLGALRVSKLEELTDFLVKNNEYPSFMIDVNEWYGTKKFEYKLRVDDDKDGLFLMIRDKETKKIISENDYKWSYDQLQEKVETKLKHIATATYTKHVKEDGSQFISFDDMKIGGYNSLNRFLEKIETSEVKVGLRFSPAREADPKRGIRYRRIYNRTNFLSKLDDYTG